MENENLKWEAVVSARIAKASADQIWPLVRDFFGIHNYFPILSSSYDIQGNNGEVGAIRYCEGAEESARTDDEGKAVARWSKEKIIAIDPTQRSLSYEITDGNTGFGSYVSTMKVLNPVNGDDNDEDDAGSCVLEWSFSVDAVAGFQFEDVVKLYQLWVQLIAQNMEADAHHK